VGEITDSYRVVCLWCGVSIRSDYLALLEPICAFGVDHLKQTVDDSQFQNHLAFNLTSASAAHASHVNRLLLRAITVYQREDPAIVNVYIQSYISSLDFSHVRRELIR